jgi:pyridoxine kinase
MKTVFDKLRSDDTLIFVDPVMADNGKLYGLFSPDFPKGMASLCEKADIIVPNITEASLLLGEEYVAGPYTKDYIEGLLHRLHERFNAKVILTGVYFDDEKLGAASFDPEKGIVDYALSDRIDGYYHGTGDVFGSAVLSGLMNGKTLADSVALAVSYVYHSIERTKNAATDIRFGVDFERGTKELIGE